MSMMIHRHKKLRAAKQAALLAKNNEQKPQTVVVNEEKQELDYADNKKTYTRTEINRLSTSELQALADNEGIENAWETSGAKLKEKLIEHFGL